MDIGSKKYPAKLLLFGEHTVLQGSASLAIPYPKYWMRWVEKKSDHPDWMTDYVSYLTEYCNNFLDIDKLARHSAKWTIKANIPIGYGLGSSGALTAAIYDVSAVKKESDLITLQRQLGKMESFFHGASSGFDPLVSYTNAPLLKKNNTVVKLPSNRVVLPSYIYLLDSGQPRSGKDMIERFILGSTAHRAAIKELSELNDQVISTVLGQSSEDFLSIIKKISRVQISLMPYMITAQVLSLWKESLDRGSCFFKVCGAGGGGYYLVFSDEPFSKVGDFTLQQVDVVST